MALGTATNDFVFVCDDLDVPSRVLVLAGCGCPLLCDGGVDAGERLLHRCSDSFLHSANLFNYKHSERVAPFITLTLPI